MSRSTALGSLALVLASLSILLQWQRDGAVSAASAGVDPPGASSPGRGPGGETAVPFSARSRPEARGSLSARVAILEAEVHRLRSGSARNSLAGPAAQQSSGGAAPSGSIDVDMAQQLEEDPEAREALRFMVTEELERRHEDRWEARTQHMQKRAEDRLEKLRGEVDLDDAQVHRMGEMLNAERQEVMALFRAARETFDWPSASKSARAIRQSTDENVRELLDDEDKMAAWDEMREEERRASRWHGAPRRQKK